MKKRLLPLLLVAFASTSFGAILIVDINGAGQFTSIQTAINNAMSGDTIQVWPGVYNEAVNLNKNILLQGSGYENTIVTSSSNPTVNVSSGIIKWFMVSSLTGDGIKISGGKITNCVVKGCAYRGIFSNNTSYQILIQNCIVLNCGSEGIRTESGASMTVVNTISRNNGGVGFAAGGYGTGSIINKLYSNGSNATEYTCSVSNNQGCMDTDPIFVSTSLSNYHISTGSPCYNAGQPSLFDPDGSASDIGYFGGPDCPVFPVVYEMIVTPNGSNINVQAKARANY